MHRQEMHAASLRSLRVPKLHEAELVHRLLQRAIGESPFYSAAFKASELGRFNIGYLRALIAANPAYVPLVITADGTVAGFILSGSEFGSLAIYWCYLLPEHRKGALAMTAIHEFVQSWEHGQFHKITAFAKPENRAPIVMMQRNGFQQVALLKQHLFGEDIAFFERPLRKAVEGYPVQVSVGLSGRIRFWVLARLLRR